MDKDQSRARAPPCCKPCCCTSLQRRCTAGQRRPLWPGVWAHPFTSPVRRYRILRTTAPSKAILQNGKYTPPQTWAALGENYDDRTPTFAAQCGRREVTSCATKVGSVRRQDGLVPALTCLCCWTTCIEGLLYISELGRRLLTHFDVQRQANCRRKADAVWRGDALAAESGARRPGKR